MKEYKILFSGTPGAGKTTAIGAVSEIPPVVTDVPNTDPGYAKAYTTVGLDYGQLTLDTGDCLRLFGTPGQARFDFLWRILGRNALGLIILLDNSRPNPLADLEIYINGFGDALRSMPCVIGVGRHDQGNTALDDYGLWLMERNMILPVLPVDVRRRADVVLLIDVLLAELEFHIRKGECSHVE